MLTDHFFQHFQRPDVFAATIGQSRNRWVSVSSSLKAHEVKQMMQNQRYDIMPIIEKDGALSRYFKTERWGDYDRVERSKINPQDTLYYLTHIRDVIHMMAEQDRKYFFLRNEDRILGLVTISNLNARPVYLYLYHTLLLLETELGEWLQNYLGEEQIKGLLKELPGGNDVHGGYKQYKEDRENGIESDILEYLFLGDMFEIIRRKNLYQELNYRTLERFDQHLQKLRQMRNTVAHPNRSLVHGAESLKELWQSLRKLEELLDRVAVKSVVPG